SGQAPWIAATTPCSFMPLMPTPKPGRTTTSGRSADALGAAKVSEAIGRRESPMTKLQPARARVARQIKIRFMGSVPRFSFSHMGMYVADASRMEDFYTRVLGFTATDRGQLGATSLVFLSRDPREHHQLVLASGRPGELPFNSINQISFRMVEFAGLREMHRRLAAEKVRDLYPVSHGNALSVYFLDPEGNRIELFV